MRRSVTTRRRTTARVVVVAAAAAAAASAALWQAPWPSSSESLAVTRGVRALTTWARLVVRYKWLSLYRPGSEASEEDRAEFEARRARVHEAGARDVLRLCRANGGLFIKMGQHATSLRPAVPETYIEVLRVLQTDAPSRPVEEVHATIRTEIKDREVAEELIRGMDPKPLGSASLAQVHACTLPTSGERVAVKVQHTNLVNVIASDLFVIKWLDRAATELFGKDTFTLAEAVAEFETNVKQELDFAREAQNALRAREDVARHPTLHDRVWVPRVFPSMSSGRVLTMELVDGVPIRKTDPRHHARLARTVIDLFAAMVFTNGFVHCDPHFGNFLVCHGGKTLALLDHGLYRELDRSFMDHHALLWRSMTIGDAAGVRQATAGMGTPQYQDLLPLILTSRPVSSRAGLGDQIPRDELTAVKKRAGYETGMSLAQFAEIAHDVPVDLLFVLRTMHLVKDLHMELGGVSRDRLYGYALAAVAYPDSVPPRTWTGAWHLTEWKATFVVKETWLWCKRWWVSSNTAVAGGGRFSLSGLMREKMEGVKDKPGRAFRAVQAWRKARVKRKEHHNGDVVVQPPALP